MPAQSARRTSISRIIKTLLALNDERQATLAEVLEVDPSQITRKMKSGRWSIDDLDAMAAHWKRPITVFFANPDDLLGGSDLDGRASRWNTTLPGQRTFDDLVLERATAPEPLYEPAAA